MTALTPTLARLGLAFLLMLILMLAAPAMAQQQPAPPPTGAAAPMPKSEPLPAPPSLNKFPTPEQAVGRELTLDEAVSIALDNAPKILASTGDYLASLQRVNQALAPLLPQLTGTGSYGRKQGISTTSGARSVNDFGSASATASQLLWDFGKQWAAKDVAKFDAEAFRAAAELQKNNIAKLVKEQYFTLLLSQRLVTVNEAALDRAEINLRSAKGFFDVGTQPKSFVTRAEVDVANARVNLIRANNAVSLARVALNAAMGVAVNTPTQVKDVLAYEHFTTDRDALLAEALRSRPDYVQIKAQAEEAEALVRQTFRDFFPNLTGSGTYGIVGVTGTPTPGSRSTSGFIDSGPEWNVGLTLQWTIFDGGGKIARYKEAKANVDAIKARVRDTELQVWKEVEQAHIDLLAKEESIGAAGKAVESAQENYNLARGRFDAGVANIIELTDAQLALTQAQATEAQALSDYRIAIAELERALGRR